MTPAASISIRVSNDINGCILPITLVVRVERSSRGACVCVCFYDNTITFKRKIIFALTNSERWVTLTQSDYVKFIGQCSRQNARFDRRLCYCWRPLANDIKFKWLVRPKPVEHQLHCISQAPTGKATEQAMCSTMADCLHLRRQTRHLRWLEYNESMTLLIFGRLFVKRFALSYRTVICQSMSYL